MVCTCEGTLMVQRVRASHNLWLMCPQVKGGRSALSPAQICKLRYLNWCMQVRIDTAEKLYNVIVSQAFYHTVKSVHNFKLEESVVSFDGFSAPPDRRSYLIAYGNYHSPDSPPGMQLLREARTNSASNLHSAILSILAVGIANFISL